MDQYPLPRVDEIFFNLSGREQFTKLDLKNAYLQMEMEIEESLQEYLTINTHRGLFRFNRLMYGVASAPWDWTTDCQNGLKKVKEMMKSEQVFTHYLLGFLVMHHRLGWEQSSRMLILQETNDQ